MYYRESVFIAADSGFNREDVEQIDRYLYQNRESFVRIGNISRFFGLSDDLVNQILDAYCDHRVVSPTKMPICECANVVLETTLDEECFHCDLCGHDFAASEMEFEFTYVPRNTDFEFGDRMENPLHETHEVDGLKRIIGSANSHRLLDVIFIHGLDGDSLASWHPEGKSNDFFPRWLGEDLSSIGVWSFGYAAKSSAWVGSAMPIQDRANNFLATLDAAGLGTRPIVVIAHSLGGLIAKQAIINGQAAWDNSWGVIVKQIKGIVFFSTPHYGSSVANWFKYTGLLGRSSALVSDLSWSAPALRQLNQHFQKHCSEAQIAIETMYEKEKTGGVLVVDEVSANPNISGMQTIPIDANHISICKPTSKSSLVYVRTRKFLQKVLDQIDMKS